MTNRQKARHWRRMGYIDGLTGASAGRTMPTLDEVRSVPCYYLAAYGSGYRDGQRRNLNEMIRCKPRVSLFDRIFPPALVAVACGVVVCALFGSCALAHKIAESEQAGADVRERVRQDVIGPDCVPATYTNPVSWQIHMLVDQVIAGEITQEEMDRAVAAL